MRKKEPRKHSYVIENKADNATIFSMISIFSKENTMLRANLKSSKISVIPNAVDASAFTPDTNLRPSSDESIGDKKLN